MLFVGYCLWCVADCVLGVVCLLFGVCVVACCFSFANCNMYSVMCTMSFVVCGL